MKMQFNKIYFLKNFETNKVESFPNYDTRATEKYLKQKNNEGYDIYESINTFIGDKRSNENIGEIKSCFIDIDVSELTNDDNSQNRTNILKEKMISSVIPIIKEIFNNYDIKPSKINVTYKGFHILYDYDNECNFITPELHKKINNFLIKKFNGDEKAKDLSRVYRTLGYIDFKNKKDFKIMSFYFKGRFGFDDKNNKLISKKVITEKFKLKYEERNINDLKIKYNKFQEKLEKEKIRKMEYYERIKININKIDQIDSLEFIDKLKKYFNNSVLQNKDPAYTKENITLIKNRLKINFQEKNKNNKFYEDDGKNTTSGLFLSKSEDNTGYQLKDFSKHERSRNYNFLKNWVLKDIKVSGKEMGNILYYTTGIALNAKNEKNSPIDKKVFLDALYSKLILPENNDQKENENGLSIITKLNYPAGFLKIFIGFMHYIHENISSNNLKVNNDSNGIEYIIEVNKLLKNVFNIYSKSSLEHNKKLFYKIIEIISKVKIEIKHKNNYSKETILIFTKLEKAKQGRNDILIIKGSNNNIKFSNNSAFFNKEILTFQKGFADTKITDLFLLINGLLNSISHDLSYSLDVIYKYLNYNHASKSVLQTLKKHLNKGKKKAFFKYYEIKDGKIAFSKREKSISNKTKNK